MSLDLMKRVWLLDIRHPKIVLLSLADQANETGACWPASRKSRAGAP
jgi:hypothetical protein